MSARTVKQSILNTLTRKYLKYYLKYFFARVFLKYFEYLSQSIFPNTADLTQKHQLAMK